MRPARTGTLLAIALSFAASASAVYVNTSRSVACSFVHPVYSPLLNHVRHRSMRGLTAPHKRITIYEDTVPWCGEDPTVQVLEAAPYLMEFNTEYFKQPTSELANLDIAITDVAWLSSDGWGTCELCNNTRAFVSKLRDFVDDGGVLIADLATGCSSMAIAPTDDWWRPFDLGLNTRALDVGPTSIPDPEIAIFAHPLATVPNNLTGLVGFVSGAQYGPDQDDTYAIGIGTFQENLLPYNAAVHLRGAFGEPLMASYDINSGTVIVDTLSKEIPWATYGSGWSSNSTVVENLVRFAVDFVPRPPQVDMGFDGMILEAQGPAGASFWFQGVGSRRITCDVALGTVIGFGPTTVTCTATNAGGTTTHSATVTVVDSQGPVITAPTAITQQGNVIGGAAITYSVSASDVVEGTKPVTCDKPSGFLFPVGTTVVTCTSSDSGNHVTTVSFNVVVIDTNGPVVCMTATAPLTQEGNTAGGAVFTYTVTATDVVEGAIVPTCNHASGSVFPVGTTAVTCTASDSSHQLTTANFHVVVTDTAGPVITVPAAAVTHEADAIGGATVTYTVSANDVVEGSTTVTCDKPSGAYLFPVGNNTVTCTATDSHDTVTTAVFYVVVADTTAPVVTMVNTSSLTLEFDSTAGGAVFNYTVAATDVVDGNITAVTCNKESGSVFTVGRSVVICSASDSSNNAASASLIVTVNAAPTPAPTPTPIAAVPQSAKSDVYVPNAWQGCLIAAASALLLCMLPIALRRRRKSSDEEPPSAELAEVLPQGV